MISREHWQVKANLDAALASGTQQQERAAMKTDQLRVKASTAPPPALPASYPSFAVHLSQPKPISS